MRIFFSMFLQSSMYWFTSSYQSATTICYGYMIFCFKISDPKVERKKSAESTSARIASELVGLR
jgi:hypothetical protein